MQKEVLIFLANTRMPKEGETLRTAFDFENLKGAFRDMDKDNSGSIEINEMKDAFRGSSNCSEEELNQIFYNVDFNQDGQVNYSEFLAATINKDKAVSQSNLEFAFHHFDVDNSGIITVENMKEVFKRQGRNVTDGEMDDLVNEINPEKAGEITFLEFSKLMN
jgi:calcium-dependent protein kinase